MLCLCILPGQPTDSISGKIRRWFDFRCMRRKYLPAGFPLRGIELIAPDINRWELFSSHGGSPGPGDEKIQLDDPAEKLSKETEGGTLLINQLGEIAGWDAGLERLTGIAAEQTLGKAFESVIDLFVNDAPTDCALRQIKLAANSLIEPAKTAQVSNPFRLRIKVQKEQAIPVIATVSLSYKNRAQKKNLLAVNLEPVLPGGELDSVTNHEPVYRNHFECLDEFILVTTLDEGRIQGANSAARVLLGYTYPELLGKTITDLIPAEKKAKTQKSLAVLQSQQSSLLLETSLVAKDGQLIPISLTASKFYIQERAYVAHTAHDLRDQKSAATQEREQRRLADALREVAATLNSTLDIDIILDRVLTSLEKVIDYSTANVMIVENGMTTIVRGRGYENEALIERQRSWNAPIDRFPILREMGRTGRPVVYPDTHQDERWVILRETSWIRSYVGAPIMRSGNLLGFININSARANEYGSPQAATLKAFADQAAIALENARLFDETRQRAERLALLNEIATAINEPGDLIEILHKAARGLGKVLEIDQTGIALLEENQKQLVVFADHQPAGRGSSVGQVIPLEGNRSMDVIFNTQKPLAILDAQKDPLLEHIHSIMAERQVKSILIVPLLINNRVIGTLGCDAIFEPREFSAEDISLAQTMAGLISSRIEQAQMLDSARQQAQELETVRKILHLTNAQPHIQEVLGEINQYIVQLTGCQRVSLAMLSENSDYFRLISTEKRDKGLVKGKLYLAESSAAAEDIFSGQLHITPDLSTERNFPAESALYEMGFRSRVNIPLLIGQQVIGTLNLVWEITEGYQHVNLALVEQVADALAMAVERGRLLDETRRRDEILETLAYGAEQLLQAPDLDHALPKLLRKLGEFAGVSRAYVFQNLAGPEGTLDFIERSMWVHEDNPNIRPGKYPIQANYAEVGLDRWAQILCSGRAMHGTIEELPEAERQVVMAAQLRSYAFVPISVRGVWWGFLGLDDIYESRQWSSNEIDALRSLADTLGGALARIDSEAAERAQLALSEALRDTTAVMTATTSIENVFSHILNSIAKILDHDASNIMLLQSGILNIACTRGYQEIGRPDPSVDFPRSITEFGNLTRMLVSGVPEITNDTKQEQQWVRIASVDWVNSNLVAPIRYQEQTIGFINLDSSFPNFFRDQDAQRLLAFANQAAIAIENTRLFEETHERALQMSLLNRMTQTAIASQSIEDVLHMLSVQMVTLLGADNVLIALWQSDNAEISQYTASIDQIELGNGYDLVSALNSLTELVLETGHSQVLGNLLDARFESYFALAVAGYRSALVLPLISNGLHLGAAFVIFRDIHSFSLDELALGEQAAGQIALAIAKANLLEAEKQKAQTLERVNDLLTALSHVAVQLESARDPDSVMKTLGEELRKMQITCFIWMSAEENNSLRLHYTSLPDRLIQKISRMVRREFGSYELKQDEFMLFDEVVHARDTIFVDDLTTLMTRIFPDVSARLIQRIGHQIGLSAQMSGFFLPLMAENKLIGTFWMLANMLTPQDQTAATIFASQVAMAIENARLYQNVQQLAITDELTHLYNRRGLMELGQREFDRARRFSRSLFALMFDLDDFRNVNNTYGHAVGDEVLIELANRCGSVLRSTDVLGRYGGEEFSVLLPETEISGAMEIAERLRFLVGTRLINSSRGPLRVTISIGVASISPECESLMMLLDWADQGLYMAKKGGKNRVAMAPNPV